MGIQTTITVTCDYSECRAVQNKPSVVQYVKELVESGKEPWPEEAKYLVLFNEKGVQKSFCCQLHAAMYFLPPGYEAKQKAVVPISGDEPKPEPETKVLDWKDTPYRRETENSPVNGPEGEA